MYKRANRDILYPAFFELQASASVDSETMMDSSHNAIPKMTE